ncbi:GNAT family N-acetyltransferase [Microbacterium gorillae]|uniref:GNAT family N-acetyltransferase n=1 Tax=Microbacterium gorillae TaxID=1231063 RepID=UPI000590F09D|nr:GNAT family N-acetyltransferase [Microbacterium gorillae]
MTERFIRGYRPGDRDALTEICLRTADDGGDASALYRYPSLPGDIWAVPYADRDPALAFVVDDGTGTAVGYTVGTDDTIAFADWFRSSWWPSVRGRYDGGGARPKDAEALAYADGFGASPSPYAATYPAHLHIDLLPEAQGGGFGRRLIATLSDELRRRGVPGVHLEASAANTDAVAFYDHIGFTRLPSGPDGAAFGMSLVD